jgi:hypothetical protein
VDGDDETVLVGVGAEDGGMVLGVLSVGTGPGSWWCPEFPNTSKEVASRETPSRAVMKSFSQEKAKMVRNMIIQTSGTGSADVSGSRSGSSNASLR